MTAAHRELHTFDVLDEINTRVRRGRTDFSAIADEVVAAIPAGEAPRVLSHAVYLLAKAARPRPAKPTTPAARASSPAPAPAASAKVSAIRDGWAQRLADWDLRGHRGRPTTLLAATREDLLAAASGRDQASQLAARQAAFLRAVAKELADRAAGAVADLPESVQRAIAERIPS